jgi:hypothetical protein
MEYLPSEPIKTCENPVAVSENLMNTFIEQILYNGVIHGDLHAGNIGIRSENQLVMYDFGNVIRIPEFYQKAMRDVLVASQDRNTNGLLKAMSDMGEFAGVDEAVAKQSGKAINPETGEEYTPIGSMKSLVEGSSPTKIDRGISMDSFSLGPNGLPIAKPKSTAAAVPEKKKDEEGKTAEEQAKDREARAKADTAKGPQGEKTMKKEGGDSKSATLDDLLKSMNALNTKVAQLIEVNETGHKSTAKATKSNASNIYER